MDRGFAIEAYLLRLAGVGRKHVVGQMQEWLDDLGLGQYAPAFKENDIDAEILVDLSDQDLEKLGIASLGHRKRILQAIAQLPAATASPADKKERLRKSAEGERRQVTVLFADLSDFTRFSSELGAEATHDLLNHYFAAVDGIVHQYGGNIDKHIGDAVMAVFGAPIAHEDDPVRAARAALDIHRAVAEVGLKLGRTLQVHVGIASGEVVASGTGSDAHREYTVTGDTVNLASRLDALAESGQTLVSDAVWRALAGCAEGRSLGDVNVKGLARAVPVWELQGLTVGRPIATGSQLMGRRAELNQFAGILDACREAEGGHAVYVRGDAGIGKTRLAEEFEAMAEALGFACHTALVLDFGAGKGQDAIRTLVRSLIDLPRGADEAVRARAAEHAIAPPTSSGKSSGSSSTTSSTSRSRPSCAPSTTPWKTRPGTGASGRRSSSW